MEEPALPPDRPLQAQRNRDPETFGPVDVIFEGAQCRLSVDGPFTIARVGDKDAERQGCICCSPPKPKTSIQISKVDVIGAEMYGDISVVVWYSELSRKKVEKPKRLLLKTRKITCGTRLEAMQIVRFVRNWATWGGRCGERRLVAVINPASGKQRGGKTFSKFVKPILEGVCGYTLIWHETKGPQDATSFISNLKDVSSCSALVVVGGDGTVHECLQGLLSRTDWEKAAKVPIIQLPTGSGNGLAASTGMWDVATGVHAICKGNVVPMDIMSVVQGSNRFFSFMGLSYGAGSTIDIGTENLRWMGETRFTVGGLLEVLKKSRYGLKFAYLPGKSLPMEDTKRIRERKAEMVPTNSPAASPLDVDVDLENRLLTEPTSTDYPSEDGDTNPKDSTSLDQSKEGSDKGKNASENGAQLLGVPLKGLNPELTSWFRELATEAKPGRSEHHGEWCAGEVAELVLFNAVNIPYLATNYHYAPRAHLGNGCMELLYVADSTRGALLDFMLKSEKGDHMDLKVVKSVRASAVWLAPGSPSSPIMVDGELVDCVPTYLEMHPRMCSVFMAK